MDRRAPLFHLNVKGIFSKSLAELLFARTIGLNCVIYSVATFGSS